MTIEYIRDQFFTETLPVQRAVVVEAKDRRVAVLDLGDHVLLKVHRYIHDESVISFSQKAWEMLVTAVQHYQVLPHEYGAFVGRKMIESAFEGDFMKPLEQLLQHQGEEQ